MGGRRLHPIISEQFAKNPRAVLPVKLEDLTPDTVSILTRNGFTEERITETLQSKETRTEVTI
jgi:hypothetical protein